MAPGRASLTVEIEVPRRALLEPQPIMIRRVLEELGRLLEHVLALCLVPGVLILHAVLRRLLLHQVRVFAASRREPVVVEPRGGGGLRRRRLNLIVRFEAPVLFPQRLPLVSLPLLRDLVVKGRLPEARVRLRLEGRTRGDLGRWLELGRVVEVSCGLEAFIVALILERIWLVGCRDRRLRGRFRAVWPARLVRAEQVVLGILRSAPDRPKRLLLEALDLTRIRSALPFELQMLANRIV